MKNRPVYFIIVLLGTALLSGCCCFDKRLPAGIAAITNFEVQFVTTGPGGTPAAPGPMQVDTGNQGCKAMRNPHNGCIEFAESDSGYITFSIKGNPKTRMCSDTGTNKVITSIELSNTPDGGATAEKGNFANLPLLPWVKAKAFPDVVTGTGLAFNVADVNDGLTHVKLFNLNRNKASDGIKSVWYRVTVKDCTNPATKVWRSDPRVDNEGDPY